MNVIKLHYLAIITLLFITTNSIFSQTIADIDTVVVKTTIAPLKANETGRNISIIKGADLQQMSFTALDDLLQYLPGIEVQSRNAFGAQGDITMRGATFTQVLILINGMKLNDPLTGHFNSYIPVTPAEIERIEVLRGAASAIYGADAVGGVINIITKGFVNNAEEETNFEGQVNYGEHRLVNTQQGFSVQKDNFFIGGGFSLNKSDGELIAEQALDNTTLEEYQNFFDLKTFGLTVGYKLNNDWRIMARSSYDDRNFSARYFYTTSTFDKSVETTRNWWNQLAVTKIGKNSSTDFRAAYRNGTDEFVFSPDFPSTNLHTTNFWNLNINHYQIFSDQFSANFGTQLDYRQIESTDRGDHSDWHYGIYAMGVYRPTALLSLTGSLRLDYDANYDLELTPQLNVSYILNRMTLRAAAGRSIRAADYTERYVSFNLENLTPERSLGNPDLVAETAWSQEIGLDYSINKHWQLRATAFFRQSDNLIDYIATNEADIPNNQNLQTGENYFFASNITEVQTNGFELESWLRLNWNERIKLQWSLGYTYLTTSNDEEVISVYISSHANHLITTNLILSVANFDLALNGLYKDRSEQLASGINARLAPSYQVWNMRLGYRLTDNFGLNLQVHNLLDEDYQDILGAQMPGRWLMGGVKFKI